MFEGKTIVVGVSGGIAAYKTAQLVSDLAKTAADVHVIMTKNACEFVTPLTFETLSRNRVSVDTFDRNFEYNVQHISLAKRADLFLIAPATANIIAKMATGIADDMLSTTVLAAGCKKIVCPAMNTGMYDNPVTQRNLDMLRALGIQVLEPASGWLACGDEGRGRLPEHDQLFEAVRRALTEQDLARLQLMVTAGPTQEALDPVRFLTNHSTGKMGYAIAQMAVRRGAKVTLISGKTALKPPAGVDFVSVSTAAQMFEEVRTRAAAQQIIIKCAAVADYRPAIVSQDKVKKSDDAPSILLERTQDILAWLGANRTPGQVLCGFSMETRDLLENSMAKLERKGVDMIVANNLKEAGAGFGTDTNLVTLITKQGAEPLALMDKEAVAEQLLTRLAAMYRAQ